MGEQANTLIENGQVPRMNIDFIDKDLIDEERRCMKCNCHLTEITTRKISARSFSCSTK